MPNGWLFVLSVILLVVVTYQDLVRWPDRNLAILYVVPLLLSSFAESAVLVVSMSALVILLDFVSLVLSKPPLGVWPPSTVPLWIVCYFALKVAGQRALIRRQAEEAARATWNQILLVEVAHELRTPSR
jgi:signal transduction histidine kinase